MISSRRSVPVRDMALALAQLTVVPVPVRWPNNERPDVASWYPLVGVLLGMTLAGVAWLVGFAGSPPLAALTSTLAMAAATRLLHWDGLADAGDAWFVPSDRRLQVLRDSRIGAFGAFALSFGVLAYVMLLQEVLAVPQPRLWGLVLVPVLGRLSATFAAWLGAPARSDGLGASVIGRPTVIGLVAATITVLAAAGGAAMSGVPWWVPTVGGLAALGIPHVVSRRFGGVTGDVMGASVVMTELVVLATLVLVPVLDGLVSSA